MNEIEIIVRVKDEAAAGMAAVKEEVKAGGAAAAAEADKAGGQIGENLANGLTRDSSGKLRNAMGRFASEAEKEAAGIGGGQGIKIPLGVDGDPFEHEFRSAMNEAERASQDAEQTITHSFGDIEKASRTVRAAAGELGPALDGAGRAGGDAGRGLEELDRKASGAGNAASSAGGSFLGMSGKVQMMAGAALALGPALAAIPAMAAGAAVGMGTLAGAFSGVIGALKDYAAQQSSAAQSGSAAAATAFANSVAIRNGEQAIADAKKSAAQAAVTSARQITDAQQSLVDAERQAAIATQSSTDSVAASEQRLAGQHQALAAAQQTLTLAERDGVNVLKDLNLAAEGAANSVVDAELAVQQATENNNKVKGNSLLTDLQKKQAAQQLVDAQFHLKDAQQKATEAQVAANDANAKGVEGSTAVVAAKQGVASASQGVADAEQALARAQEAAGNQRIASDESVAKAQQHLADSYSSAATQQAQSQQQVDRAVQSLADTQRQQALAAASASAGTNKFAQDMNGLTQPGRDFVNTVLGMKNGLHELSATAQTATLPGFTQMLRDSQGMFPIVNQSIKDMGGAIGGAAEQFGKLMKSPAFQGDMTKILKQASDFTQQIGSGIVDMVGGIAKAAAGAGPIVKGLSQGFADLMKTGIPEFFKGLTTNAGGAGQTLQGVLDLVSNLAGPLGTVSGALGGALAPAMKILGSPEVGRSLREIGDALASILLSLTPVVTMFAQGLAGALGIVAPLLQSVAKFIEDNHNWFVPLAKVVAGAAAAWWLLNAAMDANPLVLIGGLIAGLVAGIIYAWEHFKTFRDVVKEVFSDVLDFVKKWWPELLAPFTLGISEIIGHWGTVKQWFTVDIPQFFGKLVDFVKKWWPELLAPFTAGVSEIIGHWGKIEDFFKSVPGKLAAAGKGMFAWIPGLFKDAVNLVILGWDSLKFSTPKIHIPGAPSFMDIDSMSFGVPQIHTLATGGIGSGLVGINEAGMEMVRLPTGSVVMPHANTASALAGHGGSSGASLQIEWVGGNAGDEFITWLRKNIRISAGNGSNSVQQYLGQAF